MVSFIRKSGNVMVLKWNESAKGLQTSCQKCQRFEKQLLGAGWVPSPRDCR